MTWTLGIFCLYLLALVVIGILASRDTGTVEGFFLAGRSLPWWLAGTHRL